MLSCVVFPPADSSFANMIDEQATCLEEQDQTQMKRYRNKGKTAYWVCTTCYLTNKPGTKRCACCDTPFKLKANPVEKDRKQRLEMYTVLHMNAARRSSTTALLCETITKQYPLQTTHHRMFRVLESRSLIAGARAMPLDHHHHHPYHPGHHGNKTNSVWLAEMANYHLNLHWRHDTSMLLEARSVLYGCIWLR